MHPFRSSGAAVIAAVAVALATAGCRGPTSGELGKALFSYDEGALGCIAGCPPATEPMAARSSLVIHVTNADELPLQLGVSSTDESVATFEHSGTSKVSGKTWLSVGARSLAAGDVKLELADGQGGAVIDRLLLHVREVKAIEIGNRSGEFHDRLTIMEGGSALLQMILKDGSGQELRGHSGLDYDYQGSAAEPAFLDVLFGDIILSAFTGTAHEHVQVSAGSGGFGTLTATSPGGASLEIPIHVIDASAVTAVTLEATESSGVVGEPFFVNAKAMAGAEPVHSPECDWSISDVTGPVVLTQPSRASAALEATAAGAATVTCTIGGSRSSVAVAFR